MSHSQKYYLSCDLTNQNYKNQSLIHYTLCINHLLSRIGYRCFSNYYQIHPEKKTFHLSHHPFLKLESVFNSPAKTLSNSKQDSILDMISSHQQYFLKTGIIALRQIPGAILKCRIDSRFIPSTELFPDRKSSKCPWFSRTILSGDKWASN